MNGITYLNFDLHIERAATGYRARVVDSPAGQASNEFTLPFNALELENFLLRLGQTRNVLVRNAGLAESAELQAPRLFGQRLFAAVFDNEVQACLRSSQDTVRRQGARLRLRLHLTDVPELATLPWEYLYHATLNRFLALSAETPLVRYLELPDLILPVTITAPLRLLVLIASPTDHPQLDVEQEWDRLKRALADLEQRGLLVMERVEDARLAVLQQRLRQRDYHILHFIGHGGFDAQRQEGVLLLEDQAARSHPVSGQDLGMLLHDHRSLRLVVLNACQGGQATGNDPFAGVAQRLVQQRIPAVAAMQFAISDQAAISFAQEFYSALADSYPVDAALTEARKAIFAQGNKVEWGTPVLYMRAPDGQIFNVNGAEFAAVDLDRPARQETPTVLPSPVVLPPPVTVGRAGANVSSTRGHWWVWGSMVAVGLFLFVGLRLLPATRPVVTPTVTATATAPDSVPAQSAAIPATCRPTDELSSFIEPNGYYCLRYPNYFRIGDQRENHVGFYGPPLDQSSEPIAAGLFVEIKGPANGASLQDIVDQVLPPLANDIPITRRTLTLGGEPAELIEGLPGQTGSQQLFMLHAGLVYHFTFYPVDPNFPQVTSDLAVLWAAVTNSFQFMNP